jgi:predicted amidohydrolase YtcJ
MYCRRWLFLAVLTGASMTAGLVSVAQSAADWVYHGGKIYTVVDGNSTVEALVVTGERIVFAGGLAEAKKHVDDRTQWIDLGGKTMIPGLVDAHAHLRSLGKYLAQLKLERTGSPGEIREMVLEAQKSTTPGRWIEGRGWDQNEWEVKEFPTWKDLEETNANPVYFRRVDGHAAWVNRAALELCGITRETPDPVGGKIIRDADGEPTGVFIDNAKELVFDRIPDPSPAEIDEWMAAAIRHCNELGLTGMHDAGTDSADVASLNRLHQRGELTLRVYCMLSTDEKDLSFTEELLTRGPREHAEGRVMIRAIKLYADGALGSRGAALLMPYSDEPGNTGLMVEPREKLERLTRLAMENGFQVCTHAIGDRGNRVILDIYEAALSAYGNGDPRLRVEHAQVVALDDIPRFKRLGVIPSMQPTHCTSDMYWAEDRVGPERIAGAYAWRRFVKDGNRLPFGSDFPVESADPMLGIYAAITRQDSEGQPEGGWYPEEKLSVLDAVRGFTIEAAYAGFSENDLGTIAAGKLADFTVLDRDIFEISPSGILETRVTHTVVGGKIVYPARSSSP